jgi:hypothetical protein
MKITAQFPQDLLQASIDRRMEYFVKEVIVDHPILHEKLDEADQQAYPLLEKPLILLLGGAGVGKTALLNKLVERRVSRRASEMVRNRQIVPAILVEVRAPDKGGFRFAPLYRDALAQMSAPLIEQTLPFVERVAREKLIRSIAVEQSRQRLSPDALEQRFSQNLIERQVEVACFDEAINIFKVGRVRSERDRIEQLREQADKLKTFGNTTPASLVLAGAYDFFELTLSSAQIARRSVIVHMEPYTMQEVSLRGFVEALVGLLSHLPIRHEINASEHATELFLQSLGCVGLLKNILSEALLRALATGKPLTMHLVRAHYFSAAQLGVMRREMEVGIKRVREIMTNSQLARNAEHTVNLPALPEKRANRPLLPGETSPSHRHDATNKWAGDESV